MLKTLLILLAASSFAIAGSKAPVPERLLEAKSACVQNHTSAEIADKVYDEFRKWGRFQLVDSPAEADLLIVISADERAESTQLKIFDRKSGDLLWSDSRFWGRWKSATRAMIRDLRKRIESK